MSEDEEEDDTNKELDEFEAPDTPWNYMQTRLALFASFSPFETLRYYFVPYSTGPSYAYLLFSVVMGAIFSTLLVVAYLRDNALDNTIIATLDEQRLVELPPFGLYLEAPQNTSFTEGVGNAVFNSSIVTYEFEQCLRTLGPRGQMRMTPRLASCGSSLNPVSRAILPIGGATFPSLGPERAVLRGNWGSGSAAMVRATLARCVTRPPNINCSDEAEMNAHLFGSVTHLQFVQANVPGEVASQRQADDSPIELSLPTVQSWGYEVRVRYRQVEIKLLPRYFVDGSEEHFVELLDIEVRQLSARFFSDDPTGPWPLVIMEAELAPLKRIVTRWRTSFIDLVASVVSLLLIFWALGVVLRIYNKWHFIHFGRFETADLPALFERRLLAREPRRDIIGFRSLMSRKRALVRERNRQLEELQKGQRAARAEAAMSAAAAAASSAKPGAKAAAEEEAKRPVALNATAVAALGRRGEYTRPAGVSRAEFAETLRLIVDTRLELDEVVEDLRVQSERPEQ